MKGGLAAALMPMAGKAKKPAGDTGATTAAAEELIAAVKAGNAAGVVDAFKAMSRLCAEESEA